VNGRGQYGRTYVGAGAIIHSPGETESELNTLHGEIMQFGQEALTWNATHGTMDATAAQLDSAQRKAWDALHAFEQTSRSDPKNPFLSNPKWMPEWERLHKAYLDLREQLAAYDAAHPQATPWYRATWKPFFDDWSRFYHEKKDISLQMWPGSGTWDHIQDYRKKLIEIRASAPFTAQGPAPLDPEKRRDPDITGGIGDLFKGAGNFVKYGAYAALGIVGVVALSSVVQNLRSGKDPAENYMELIRRARPARRPRRPRPRPLPSPVKAQALLPAGELEDLT